MSKLPFPERVLHQHIAVLGKTGSGKSSVLRVIAEHLLDKQKRIFVIDPKGDWWGLKSSADGKSAGYPVIAFGDFKEPRATDVPINQASGRHVAELIATGNRPCIIGFRGWMPGQLTKFWLDFAPAIFNLNEGELYGFISEIHNFAPKGKILDPDSGKMIHWTNRIMSEGRGIGLTFFIDSQRSQKVHNDTLDNCETLVAMRVTHPAARQSIKEWIDGNGDPKVGKEVLDTLASLVRGEAWVWSPETDFGPSRVQFPMFSTFDSFAPPQLQKKVSQAGWSEVNLDQVREKLATVIAEAKANDPKELKAEVARLKHELSKKTHAAAPLKPTTVVDERAIERAVKAATAPLLARLASIRKQARYTVEALAKAAGPLNEIANLDAPEIPSLPVAPTPAPAPVRIQTPTIRAAPAQTNGDAQLSNSQLKVLSRLVELLECTGQSSVKKEQLAAWSEYSPTSGGYNNLLGSLRSAGYIDYPQPGMVHITDAGRAIAQPENIPVSSDEMRERAKRVLNGSEAKLIDILHRSRETWSKEQLGQESGFSHTSGGFNNYLGHMRTLGFVEYPAPGQVKAADWLYL